MVGEIHTITARVDGDTVATIVGDVDGGDTPASLRAALIAALWDQDEAEVTRAFDDAFARCEKTPGDGASATAIAGDASIEVTRTID